MTRVSTNALKWAEGKVVYQIFVDRFCRSAASGALHVSSPRVAHEWPLKDQDPSAIPRAGVHLPDVGAWSHELDFWGGNLAGIQERLPYLKELGIEILYLTPLFKSFTNHRYDTEDYFTIDPMVGTEVDLSRLCDAAHEQGIRVILDGVFNHCGQKAPWFVDAQKHEKSQFRKFFEFTDRFKNKYRAWKGVQNLPEFSLENKTVRKVLWNDKKSVVRSYLKHIDGWRLDVAHDIGPVFLRELRAAARKTKKNALIIGEVWNYPAIWVEVIDGIIQFFWRDLMFDLFLGRLSPLAFARTSEKMIEDCGIEALRRCWLILDNHDTARLPQLLTDKKLRDLTRLLQFTLPGCPQLYYGNELDLEGGREPECRAPMPWYRLQSSDGKISTENVDPWLKQCIRLHRENQALRTGDCYFAFCDHLVCFVRDTRSLDEMRIIVFNPSAQVKKESIVFPDWRISHHGWVVDLISQRRFEITTASLFLELQPHEAVVLKLEHQNGEYWPYRRL